MLYFIFCVVSDEECMVCFFFFQAEDGIRDFHVTGVQTCALPIWESGGMVPGRAAGGIVTPRWIGPPGQNRQGHCELVSLYGEDDYGVLRRSLEPALRFSRVDRGLHLHPSQGLHSSGLHDLLFLLARSPPKALQHPIIARRPQFRPAYLMEPFSKHSILPAPDH